jgi:membrane protein YqaA with SNARE-associated domain
MRNFVKEWHARSWPWFQTHAQSRHALAWLALVAFSDAIFFPIAPEIFLIALMLAHPAKWRSYLPVAIVSSMAGAAVGYSIAAFLFHQFGEPILVFYHLEKAFTFARHFIAGHVFWAMAVASFTPIPDKVFIYAGGFLGVHFFPFIAGYFLGRGIRMALVVYLTGKYGADVLGLINRYLLWFGALLVVLATIYGMVHWHLLGL